MATAAQLAKAAGDPIVDPHVALLIFREDGAEHVLRAVIDNEDLVSNVEDGVTARTYVRSTIEHTIVGAGQGAQSAKLEMSNVTRVPGRLLLQARRQIGVRMIVVDRAAPNVKILDTYNLMVIRRATVTAEMVSVQLEPRADLQEPHPLQRVMRQNYEGAFFLPR